MSKLSLKEKLLLTFIVTNCEIYSLNEEEALEYIQYNLSKPISRRTYYNYKKTIYDNCSLPYDGYGEYDKKDLHFHNMPNITNSINCKKSKAILLLNAKRDLIQKGLEINVYLNDFDKLNSIPIRFINSLDNALSVIDHSENFIENFKQGIQENNPSRKSLPGNVTIRSEYVKCGKNCWSGCNHGPYYYWYWREENGKLRKKYIGISV